MAKHGDGDRIGSRFWFRPAPEVQAGVRDGVVALMGLDPGVEMEVLYAVHGGEPVRDLAGVHDEVGDVFARQVAVALRELAVGYPELAHVRPLLGLVALAQGAEKLGVEGELGYWLRYRVERAATPDEFDLIAPGP